MLIVNEQKVLYRKEDVPTPQPDEDHVPPEMEHESPWDNLKLSDIELIDKITIEGSPKLRATIRELCLSCSNIFSCELRPEPADLQPMRLEVDVNRWFQLKHRGPARQ